MPDADSASIGRLAPGETVLLEEPLSGWYRVRTADGRVGYVSKARTKVVDDGGAKALIAPAGETTVHVIDVGTGLAVFVEVAGFTMAYDAGSQDDLTDGAYNRVVSYIHSARPDVTAIDHMILSHPHKDHLELMPDGFAAFNVRNVWDSGTLNKTVEYCKFLKAVAAEPGVRYHNATESGATGRSPSPTAAPTGPSATSAPR